MLNRAASPRDVLAQLRKRWAQTTRGAVRVPFYSLIADKAQKANIASRPEPG